MKMDTPTHEDGHAHLYKLQLSKIWPYDWIMFVNFLNYYLPLA